MAKSCNLIGYAGIPAMENKGLVGNAPGLLLDGRRPSSRRKRGRVASLSPDLFRRPENSGTNQIAVFKWALSETRNTLCNTRSTLCNTTYVNVIRDE